MKKEHGRSELFADYFSIVYWFFSDTYRKRERRGAIADERSSGDHIDVSEAEKQLVAALGERVCVYERVCAHYAARALQKRHREHIDWGTILRLIFILFFRIHNDDIFAESWR